MGAYVSKEQYMAACAADLYEFLTENHASDIKTEYGSALLLDDDHVSVKRGYHGYLNFRTGEKGNNVDYLMNFLGYDYPGAVLALTGGDIEDACHVPSISPPHSAECGVKEITLPEPLEGRFRNLFAYLSSRGIPADIIQDLVDKGVLYQSAEGNNVVFVSPEGDYCEIRGTNSYADRRCKRRKECSRYRSGEHTWCELMDTCSDYKPDPFHGCRKAKPDRFWYFDPDPGMPTKNIYVCEAAIDAVSLYAIHQQYIMRDKGVYVSIGGAANQRTIDRICRGSRGRNVVLAVDNDEAGDKCRDRNPELEALVPVNKDWNEDLREGDY